MLRAKYILRQPHESAVYAIYGTDARREDLEPLLFAFKHIPGTEAMVRRVTVDDGSQQVFALQLAVNPLYNRRASMLKLKELAEPELPIALGHITVDLMFCTCHYFSTKFNGEFLEGFEPEDKEAFWLRFYAEVAKFHADQFIDDPEQGFVEPYDAAAELVTTALAHVGAFASSMLIQPGPDPRPCTHD